MLKTIIAIAGLAVASAAAADLHEDMVKLDRAYIPALVITNQPLSPTTRRSMERLREEWNGYRARYPKAPAGFTEASWTKADKAIESSIADAEASVKAGKPTVAHEALERVRDAQYALRRGNGVSYWMDDFTAFHAAMEDIAGAAAGKNAGTLTDGDVASIRAAMPQAQRTWQALLAGRGESARYGVSAGQAEALQRQLDVQTQTLSDLKAALEREDRAEIAAKAVATKPAFSKLMQMFGDFAAVRGG
jgi:hypothetical protein